MANPLRPDPTRGVFETVLVLAGAAVERDPHLARLERSLRALYGAALPPRGKDLIAGAAEGLALGRVRLTVAPRGGGLGCEVAAAEVDPGLVFPAWDGGADLHRVHLDGGLGAHKWADRSFLQSVEATAGSPDSVPLLLDADGEVLEAAWANVFAVLDGVLITPPLDGRILPGVTRSLAIEIAGSAAIEVHERGVGGEELLGAEEVFLTGSVRGLAPARSLDGAPLPHPGRVSRLVGDALRRRWTPARAADAVRARAAGP